MNTPTMLANISIQKINMYHGIVLFKKYSAVLRGSLTAINFDIKLQTTAIIQIKIINH